MPPDETQAQETPAETTPEVSGQGSSTGDPLLDALAGYVPESEEKTDPDSPAAKEAEKEAQEKTPEQAGPKKGKELEKFLLSDEQLAKPDGVKKAAEFLTRKRSKLDAIEIRNVERAKSLHDEREAAERWFSEENSKLETDREKARYIVKVLDTLENGELPDVLETLGRLRKRSGVEVWEGLAKLAIAGKRPEKNAELEAVKQELAETRRLLLERDEARENARAEREEQAEIARLQPLVAEREAAVLKEASDAAKYPALAVFTAMETMREPILQEVRNLRRAARERGQVLDMAGALATINAELAKLSPAGAKPAVPASETPAARVAATVTSIAPSQARSAPTVRDKTERELAEDLARDRPALEQLLGISLG